MPEKQYFTGIDVINAPRIESLNATEDGTYTAPTGVIGYNPVVVNTNQPWQPLEDGYSNFWFELTNDTLSPWLNFSAKNANAVIDWGDGSGEQALDTLTPTHTYSKAGRYVVKVKGVTGIAAQQSAPFTKYCYCLSAIELNNEVTEIRPSAFFMAVSLKNVSISYVTTIGASAFTQCSALSNISLPANLTSLELSTFQYGFSLSNVVLPANLATIANTTFYYCRLLNSIVIPATVTSIGNSAFAYCLSLLEIHVQATTPPTLGTNVFQGLLSNFIIYVPVGTGETYKSASGWSTYADHILEEGQQPNRAMLAKFNSTNTDNEEMR